MNIPVGAFAMMSIMFFIFLCFIGISAMLYYVLRCQERHCRMLREDNAELRVLLRALESRMARLEGDAPVAAPVRPAAPAAEAPAERDSLLHLSFDAPAPERAAPRAAATDPGLDLHFDADAAPSRR